MKKVSAMLGCTLQAYVDVEFDAPEGASAERILQLAREAALQAYGDEIGLVFDPDWSQCGQFRWAGCSDAAAAGILEQGAGNDSDTLEDLLSEAAGGLRK